MPDPAPSPLRLSPILGEVAPQPPNLGEQPVQTETSPAWRVTAGSVRGVSHERAGMACQDAYAWHVTEQGVLIAALADGAGSAPLAEIGAQVAVAASIEALKGRIAEFAPRPPMPGEKSGYAGIFSQNWGIGGAAGGAAPSLLGEKEGVSRSGAVQSLLLEALTVAHHAVAAEAARHGAPERDLATTLIVLLADADGAAAAQIGDGAVVFVDEADRMEALTRPPEAEYANETTFLTSPDALKTPQVAFRAGRLTALAVFTDGLQRLALRLPEGEPHPPFFTPLFRFAAEVEDPTSAQAQLTAFLKSPRIMERADDDLTLLLAILK